jgi:hypothetical protein
MDIRRRTRPTQPSVESCSSLNGVAFELGSGSKRGLDCKQRRCDLGADRERIQPLSGEASQIVLGAEAGHQEP